ncbi:D-2-hydroxyacid dehydrogenase [Agarivorans aestuarii]|uniref:D-2-hydroxyacid dehydrogenase n=1 Tax=Agarivorans aestuarii TaxID=1563703 RepID=A0ABU7GB62_9ALTE|nr:D-2-hydroxyacid dehydrogenase [Agarivorans aestuarii]MEE1675700.1 D-2-hydroxyacid dehydrogenase [Agarivorans aestuarii]
MQITIVTPHAERYVEALRPRFPLCQWVYAEEAHKLESSGLASEVLLAIPSEAAKIILQMPNLQWLHSSFAGVDALLQAHLPKHYLLTNSRGVFGPLMSEYVFSYLLAHAQQHDVYQAQQQQGLWQPQTSPSLQGETFCCVGSGNISQHLAKTAVHFGMRPVALSHSGNAKAPFSQVASFEQHQQLCSSAKAVVAVLPNTPNTRGLLSTDFFASLADEVLFFNVGRGDTLDQDALLRFLQAKPKAKAILDVTSPEPLPSVHPLWSQSNCIITPHIAAPSRMSDIIELFACKLEHYLAGEELTDRVDFTKGY